MIYHYQNGVGNNAIWSYEVLTRCALVRLGRQNIAIGPERSYYVINREDCIGLYRENAVLYA